MEVLTLSEYSTELPALTSMVTGTSVMFITPLSPCLLAKSLQALQFRCSFILYLVLYGGGFVGSDWTLSPFKFLV